MSDAAKELSHDEALKRVVEFAASLGYVFGIVALMPKTRTPVPIVEYLPDGVGLQIVLAKKDDADLPKT